MAKSPPSRCPLPSPATALATAGLLGSLLLPLPGAAQGASYEQLQTFSSLLNQIRTSYVDSVTYAELVHAAVDGVLGSLDPHSRFLRRADADREQAYESGALAGTGIVLDEVDGVLTVLTVIPRSPAARAGVAAGDRLISVNDTASGGLTHYEVGLKLLGEKGTKVRLLLERGSRLEPDTVSFTLKYDFLQPRSVSMARMLDPTTAYVRLSGFHLKAGEEVEKALKDLKGKGMKRLLLDLRGNPGGFMGGPVDIAGLFLPKKTLVFRTQGRRPSTSAEIFTERDGSYRDLPLMLLVDEGSASASEALAGSLQDHDRALLVGRRSFGKALIQQSFSVPPQGDMVWLTVGRVVTPSGRVIQRAYQGLRAEQYYSFAGRAGAPQDTAPLFQTDHHRPVRGGGGITPDIELPHPAALPNWWGVVADSGWIEAVADSVAALLPKDQAAGASWLGAPDQWQSGMVTPLLSRVQIRLKVSAVPPTAVSARLGRILAYRATEVRWGPEAAESLLLKSDPDIKAATPFWDRLDTLLGGQ